MKNFLLRVAYFFFTLFYALGAQAITIGFIPGGDATQVRKGALLVAEELQKELGTSVNVYISKDYRGLIDAMKKKKVDFAFFTSLTFVTAEKEAGAKVLLKKIWEEPFYYSAVLTSKSSGVRKLIDLKGKRIAFVDKNSTSGYLYPMLLFKNAGLSESDLAIQFSGSHLDSVRLLEEKKVEAIAIFSDDTEALKSAWTKYSKDKNLKNVRLLAMSEPIPNDPFCVRQDFYDKNPKVVHNLMFSLIDIVERLKNKKEIQEFVGAQGFMPATSRQYDSVRQVVSELKIGGKQ